MRPVQSLRRFHFAEFSSTEEYRHYLAQRVGTREIEFPSGTQNFGCSVNHLSMQQLSLFAYAHRADIFARSPREESYRFQICLSGQTDIATGDHRIRLRPGNACMLTAYDDNKVSYSGFAEQIVLRVTADVLKNKLQTMIGTRPVHNIKFDPMFHTDPTSSLGLHNMTMHLIHELDASGTTDSIAVSELQNLVTTMVLLGNRHNYSAVLAAKPKSSAPFQVRLAEEYMEANWDRPITIETLTEVTGVSARSLFERFQSFRGISPMVFLRQVRLRQARKMLMSPKPDTTVTGVALACGFLNTGHFARHYREAFGELPSKILTASRSFRGMLTGASVTLMVQGWFSLAIQVVKGLGT
ncbi:MAG: AraC family transcriptional regulator [Pseudomonadota bacterium]